MKYLPPHLYISIKSNALALCVSPDFASWASQILLGLFVWFFPGTCFLPLGYLFTCMSWLAFSWFALLNADFLTSLSFLFCTPCDSQNSTPSASIQMATGTRRHPDSPHPYLGVCNPLATQYSSSVGLEVQSLGSKSSCTFRCVTSKKTPELKSCVYTYQLCIVGQVSSLPCLPIAYPNTELIIAASLTRMKKKWVTTSKALRTDHDT